MKTAGGSVLKEATLLIVQQLNHVLASNGTVYFHICTSFKWRGDQVRVFCIHNMATLVVFAFLSYVIGTDRF